MIDSASSLKLFYCYAREDKTLRDKLEIGLSGLKHQYNLIHWHDREIPPGKEWERVIDGQIDSADIILLLISPNFVASDYCYSKEMQRALERYEAGMCCVIPILLHPIHLEEMPFSKIECLPTNGKAISSWRNRHEAFCNIAKGVSTTIKKIFNSQKTHFAQIHPSTKKREEHINRGEAEFIDIYEYFLENGHMQKNYTYMLSNSKEIDIDMLEFVIRNSDVGDSYFLDTETGQVVCSSEIDETFGKGEEELEEFDDIDRYILIRTRIDSYEAYQWREDFVTEIVLPRDKQLSNILYNELEKKRPFRGFKDALNDMDKKWIQAWRDWEDFHLTEVINEWFESLPKTARNV